MKISLKLERNETPDFAHCIGIKIRNDLKGIIEVESIYVELENPITLHCDEGKKP